MQVPSRLDERLASQAVGSLVPELTASKLGATGEVLGRRPKEEGTKQPERTRKAHSTDSSNSELILGFSLPWARSPPPPSPTRSHCSPAPLLLSNHGWCCPLALLPSGPGSALASCASRGK